MIGRGDAGFWFGGWGRAAPAQAPPSPRVLRTTGSDYATFAQLNRRARNSPDLTANNPSLAVARLAAPFNLVLCAVLRNCELASSRLAPLSPARSRFAPPAYSTETARRATPRATHLLD